MTLRWWPCDPGCQDALCDRVDPVCLWRIEGRGFLLRSPIEARTLALAPCSTSVVVWGNCRAFAVSLPQLQRCISPSSQRAPVAASPWAPTAVLSRGLSKYVTMLLSARAAAMGRCGSRETSVATPPYCLEHRSRRRPLSTCADYFLAYRHDTLELRGAFWRAVKLDLKHLGVCHANVIDDGWVGLVR